MLLVIFCMAKGHSISVKSSLQSATETHVTLTNVAEILTSTTRKVATNVQDYNMVTSTYHKE